MQSPINQSLDQALNSFFGQIPESLSEDVTEDDVGRIRNVTLLKEGYYQNFKVQSHLMSYRMIKSQDIRPGRNCIYLIQAVY